MTILKTILSVALVAGVSACSSSNSETALPPEVQVAKDKLVLANAMDVTTSADMPTSGSGTYTGKMGFGFNGDVEGGALADISMTANFAANTAAVSASNVQIFGDDIENQTLTGTLNSTGGSIAGTALTGTMSGTLSGTSEGEAFSTTANLTLAGDFRSSNPGTADADVVSGTVTGGFSSEGLTASVVTGENNGFYACMPNCTTLLP